ncbi:38086_t:CDS:2, partial [Gigaspora margarita]
MSDPLPEELNDLIDKIIRHTNQIQVSRLQDKDENLSSLTDEYSYSEFFSNNISKLKNMEVNTLETNKSYLLNDKTELQETDESNNAELHEPEENSDIIFDNWIKAIQKSLES